MTTLQANLESQAVNAAKASAKLKGSDEFACTTRFGEITLDRNLLVNFPHGIFGFETCTSFGLAPIPNQPNSPMLLLHCAHQQEITFIVGAPEQLGLKFEKGDIEAALEDIGFSPADTQVLVILTIYQTADGFSITANLRAPILVDTSTRLGTQYILGNQAYGTQQKVG